MAMQRSFLSLVSVGFLLGVMAGANAQDDDEAPASTEELQARQMEIDTRSQATLDGLLETNEGAKILFEQAAGYAAFTVTKRAHSWSPGPVVRAWPSTRKQATGRTCAWAAVASGSASVRSNTTS